MPITNKDFLVAANNILQHGKREIDFKNSISRAYYAGYHEAENLEKKGLVSRLKGGGSLHKRLISALNNNSDSNIKRIGYLLNTCRLERTRADYELSIYLNESRALNVIAMISEVLEIARNYH